MKTNILFLLLTTILTAYPQEGSETVLALNGGDQLRLNTRTVPKDISASVTRFLNANPFGLNKAERDDFGNFVAQRISEQLSREKSRQYDLKQVLLQSWNILLGEIDMPGVQPALAADATMIVILEDLRAHDRLVRDSEQKRSYLPSIKLVKLGNSWVDELDPATVAQTTAPSAPPETPRRAGKSWADIAAAEAAKLGDVFSSEETDDEAEEQAPHLVPASSAGVLDTSFGFPVFVTANPSYNPGYDPERTTHFNDTSTADDDF